MQIAGGMPEMPRRLPPGRRGLKPRQSRSCQRPPQSPSPRKAWIETALARRSADAAGSRLPPGRRGLKPRNDARHRHLESRLPPGRRGLKHSLAQRGGVLWRRLPPGRRGLKLFAVDQRCQGRAGRLPPGRRGLKHVSMLLSGQLVCVAFPPEGVD